MNTQMTRQGIWNARIKEVIIDAGQAGPYQDRKFMGTLGDESRKVSPSFSIDHGAQFRMSSSM